MQLSRRTFLGAISAGIVRAGVTHAGLGPGMRDRRYRKIDEDVARYYGPVQGCGFLDQPAFALDNCARLPQATPQSGDVMFSMTRDILYAIGHRMSGAGQPSHSGYVFRRPNGTFALMEAGAFDVAIIVSVRLPDVSATWAV